MKTGRRSADRKDRHEKTPRRVHRLLPAAPRARPGPGAPGRIQYARHDYFPRAFRRLLRRFRVDGVAEGQGGEGAGAGRAPRRPENQASIPR